MATPALLAHLNGSLAYENGGAGGTGTSSGGLVWTDGYTAGTQAALIQRAATNRFGNGSAETDLTNIITTGTGITLSRVTTGATAGTYAVQVVTDGTATGQGVIYDSGVIADAGGATYAGAVDVSGSGALEVFLRVYYTDATNVTGTTVAVTATAGGARVKTPTLATNGAKTIQRWRLYVRTASAQAVTFRTDAAQVEAGSAATSYTSGTRAAATVSFPLAAAPAAVAVRYSDDDGASWDVAHLTSLTGTNVGAAGQVSHSGGNLVLASTGATIYGPVFAFSDVPTASEQARLESTDTWSWHLVDPVPSLSAVDVIDVIEILARGLDGESADAVRMSAIEAEQASLSDTLGSLSTADLTNIDESGAATGMALLRNAANDGYELATPPSGPIVRNGDDSVHIANATAIIAQAGVTVTTNGSFPTFAYIEPQYGGTGSKNLLPHSDHSHTLTPTAPVTYPSKGTLSSGAVTLVSTNVTLPAAGVGEIPKVYTVTVRTRDTQTGLGGSSYYTPKITIGGTASTSWERRTVGGVPLPGGYEFTRQITGAGTSVAILVEQIFSSGDPLTVEAGAIYIDVDCNR